MMFVNFWFHKGLAVSRVQADIRAKIERTMAGLAAARRAGKRKVGDRKPVMTPAKLDAARTLLNVGKAQRR